MYSLFAKKIVYVEFSQEIIFVCQTYTFSVFFSCLTICRSCSIVKLLFSNFNVPVKSTKCYLHQRSQDVGKSCNSSWYMFLSNRRHITLNYLALYVTLVLFHVKTAHFNVKSEDYVRNNRIFAYCVLRTGPFANWIRCKSPLNSKRGFHPHVLRC